MNFEFCNNISIDDFFNKHDNLKFSFNVFDLLDKNANILINKSDRDMWRLSQDSEGNLIVERLFDKGE